MNDPWPKCRLLSGRLSNRRLSVCQVQRGLSDDNIYRSFIHWSTFYFRETTSTPGSETFRVIIRQKSFELFRHM
jgi:hypothetical protein